MDSLKLRPDLGRRLLHCALVLNTVSIAAGILANRIIHGDAGPLLCRWLLDTGRWSHDFDTLQPHLAWNPTGCMLKEYNPDEVATCLATAHLIFVGDSSARQLFWAFAMKLDEKHAVKTYAGAPKHSNLAFESRETQLRFIWDPYLNLTSIEDSTIPTTATLIVSGGLWHCHYLHSTFVEQFSLSVSDLLDSLRCRKDTAVQSLPGQQPLFLPVLLPEQTKLSPARTATLTASRISSLNKILRSLSEWKEFDVLWTSLHMTEDTPSAYDESGIHLVDTVTSALADVVLNRLCNAQLSHASKQSKHCCSPAPSRNAAQTILLLMTLLAGCLWCADRIRQCFCNYPRVALQSVCNNFCSPGVIFLAVVWLCYAADRTTLFEKSSKLIDERLFTLLCLSCIVISCVSLVRLPPRIKGMPEKDPAHPGELLPRHQTEEWKGWMQIIILLYHYFGMSKVLWVYRFVRLLVASYLFLTGYGHATYFLQTNDFSFRRVMFVLLRLNLLSCTLPYVMGTHYDLYYFPALSSLWFLITWATIGKTRTTAICTRKQLVRILISAIAVKVASRANHVLQFCFESLGAAQMIRINHHEFTFRLNLDGYIVYVGMVFAVVNGENRENALPNCSIIPNHDIFRRYGRRLGSFMSLCALATYFLLSCRFADKFEFNRWHAITSPWPILAYIYLRNACPALPTYHNRAFAWVGRCSLETFVLQYHIWLAADTKGLLHLGLFHNVDGPAKSTINSISFWANFLLVSALFLWISNSVSTATSKITSWIVGPKSEEPNGNICAPVNDWSQKWRGLSTATRLKLNASLILLTLWLFSVFWHFGFTTS